MIKPQQTQEAFQLLQHLAALAATPRISPGNREIANTSIQNILTKIIVPAVNELTATTSGVLIK